MFVFVLEMGIETWLLCSQLEVVASMKFTYMLLLARFMEISDRCANRYLELEGEVSQSFSSEKEI